MSVFNENGALIYANNSGISNVSLDSIIAESARMDRIIESMTMEAIGQFNAANIVLETTGYVNESFKEVAKNAWTTAINALLKALDNVIEFFNGLGRFKHIISINKKKITDKFNEAKNSDNEKLKACAKAYNAVSKFNSKDLLEKIEAGIKLTNQKALSADAYAETLGFSRQGDWKMDIDRALSASSNPSDSMSSININNAIETATTFDKNIPTIKQKRRDVEKSLKDIEKLTKSGSDTSNMPDKAGLGMVSYYCVTAIKTLRLLASSSTKLCMAILNFKTSKKKDSKSDDSDTTEEE